MTTTHHHITTDRPADQAADPAEPRDAAPAVNCCDAEAQAQCCEPSSKPTCCGADHGSSSGCGCQ